MKRGEIARHVSRGAFFLAVEKVAALLSGMLYFALMLRWLGPTNYGILTLALAVTGFASVLTGNFEVFLERYAAEYQARRRYDLLFRAHGLAVGLKVVLGLLASGVVVVAIPILVHQFEVPALAVLLPILVFTVASDGLYTTGRSLLFGLQRFEWVSGLSLLFHISKTVLVGMLWWAQQGLVAMAVGLAVLTVAQALLFSLVALLLAHQTANEPATSEPAPPGPDDDRPLWRQMMGYCLPLLGARAAFLSGQNLGKLLLAKVLDPTQLGYFTFAFQTIERFVELVYALPSALLPSLTHLVARAERERLGYIFDQAFRLVQVAACAVAWCVFAFSPELTLWVGSPLFLPSLAMLQVLALVPIARTAQQPLTMLFQATRRPGLVLTLAMVKLGVEMTCYVLVVPRLGGLGAAYANLAGAVFSYLAALAFSATLLPETAWSRAGTLARALLLTVPMLIAAAFVMYEWPSGVGSLFARVVLVVPATVSLFALGLLTRYDLEKLSALDLRSTVLRRIRDAVVAAIDPLARVFEPRRPA